MSKAWTRLGSGSLKDFLVPARQARSCLVELSWGVGWGGGGGGGGGTAFPGQNSSATGTLTSLSCAGY